MRRIGRADGGKPAGATRYRGRVRAWALGLAAVLALGAGPARASRDGHSVIILMGDSQVYPGDMARALESLIRLSRPDTAADVIACGFNAETAGSALAGDRVRVNLAPYRPDLVLVNYGINDLAAGSASYVSHMDTLFAQIKSKLGSRLGYVTPIGVGTAATYDSVMAVLRKWEPAPVEIRIDAAKRRLDSAFAAGRHPFKPTVDGVHITRLTAWIYAAQIAKGLGFALPSPVPLTLRPDEAAPPPQYLDFRPGQAFDLDYGTPFRLTLGASLPDGFPCHRADPAPPWGDPATVDYWRSKGPSVRMPGDSLICLGSVNRPRDLADHKIWFAWDSAWFYAVADVRDDSLWFPTDNSPGIWADGIELFLDTRANWADSRRNPEVYRVGEFSRRDTLKGVGQVVIIPDPADPTKTKQLLNRRTNKDGSVQDLNDNSIFTGLQSEFIRTPEGFLVALRLPLADLEPARTAAGNLGLSLAVDDRDEGRERDRQYSLDTWRETWRQTGMFRRVDFLGTPAPAARLGNRAVTPGPGDRILPARLRDALGRASRPGPGPGFQEIHQ